MWRENIRVKSDLARTEAPIVAMAASLQLITTKVGASTFSSQWLITPKGIVFLNEQDDTEG